MHQMIVGSPVVENWVVIVRKRKTRLTRLTSGHGVNGRLRDIQL